MVRVLLFSKLLKAKIKTLRFSEFHEPKNSQTLYFWHFRQSDLFGQNQTGKWAKNFFFKNEDDNLKINE